MSETPERKPRLPYVNGAIFVAFIGTMLYLIGTGALREMRAASARDGDTPFLAGTHEGVAAPVFQAQTLSGRAVNFPDDYRGKIVLVDFWATWCGPCVAEYPHLVEAYAKYHDRGFEILGVSLDGSRGVAAANVTKFLQSKQAAWDVVYADAESIAGDYRVSAIPSAFLVDGNTGQIIAADDQTRGAKLLGTIEAALKR